jgi:hypothetical protein
MWMQFHGHVTTLAELLAVVSICVGKLRVFQLRNCVGPVPKRSRLVTEA